MSSRKRLSQLGVNSRAAAAGAGAAAVSASFPDHRSAAARPPSGPRAGQSPATRGGQPRARLSSLGHRVCGAASFPACGPIAAWPPLSAAAMDTDGRAAGALLARARTLHLQTGNLLNWGRLRKKCPSTHSEEVRAGERCPRRHGASGPDRRPGRAAPRGEEAPGGMGGWSGSVRIWAPLAVRRRTRSCCWGQRVLKNLAMQLHTE